MRKISSDYLLLVIGSAAAFALVLALPQMYFRLDLDAFWRWSLAWNQDWRSIYVDCPTCNYPIVGMFLSAGLVGLLRNAGLGFQNAALIYRLGLGVVDGANILIIFWILKRLEVAKAAAWAGLIGVSTSSWAGGALWGQIDDFSQFFILLALALVVTQNTSLRPAGKSCRWYLAAVSLLLGVMMLTKQLTLFSCVALGLLLATDAWFHARAWQPFLLDMLLCLLVLLVVLFGWDLALKPVGGYPFHLEYIWMAGTYLPGIISGNGFNIWMLLGRDMWSSAYLPLLPGLPYANPYLLGEILFVVGMAAATLSLGLFAWGQYRRGEDRLNRELLLNFILYLALINLCFNVFLTGTHERYLFHFYPYIITAWVGLAAYSKYFTAKRLAALVLCANLYGLYILQIMNGIVILPNVAVPGAIPADPNPAGMATQILMALIHLALAVFLFTDTLRYQQFVPNLQAVLHRRPVPTRS